MPREEWRDVPGLPVRVSTHGRVARRRKSGVWAEPGHGTPCWRYRNIIVHGHRFGVHVLVALAFHGPQPFPGAIVRHLNDIGDDNRPENLAWGTYPENAADAKRNGRTPSGVADRVRELLAQGVRPVQVAREVGCSRQRVHQIGSGRRSPSAYRATLNRVLDVGAIARSDRFAVPEPSLLGTASDQHLAKRWGLSPVVVRARRRALGIPRFRKHASDHAPTGAP